jgi:endoglucanase
MTNLITRRSLLASSVAAASTAAIGLPGRSASAEERNLLLDKRPNFHPDSTQFGCYDPYGDFKDQKEVVTEHLFLPWEDVELGGLGAADEYAMARNRDILITIEPWSWAKDWNVTPARLRANILSGKRDANMRAVLAAVANFKSPITIRWAQEMENPSGRFTWANWRPKDWIEAYLRMMAIVREMLPKAKLMWSPKGLKNLDRYYPGDKNVDIVGLSVFGLEDYDKIVAKRPRTFAELVKPGYDLTVGYKKPIWVAELGYEGSLPYLQKWVDDVTNQRAAFPELKKVIYFNDHEVWEWPYGLGLPDWRVVRDKTYYPLRKR